MRIYVFVLVLVVLFLIAISVYFSAQTVEKVDYPTSSTVEAP